MNRPDRTEFELPYIDVFLELRKSKNYIRQLEEYATHLEQQIKTVQISLLEELYYSRKLSQQHYFEEKRKLK